MSSPVQFLWNIWGKNGADGDFVCVSSRRFEYKGGKKVLDEKGKPKSRWEDHYFPYDRSLRIRLRDWFKQYPSKDYDLYFCPTPLTEDSRRRDTVKATNLLWSDIDNGDPDVMRPTILWESSPGRYQALWELDKVQQPSMTEALNQRVAEEIGGDNSGWDLTQVLRIPGTHNLKRDKPQRVKLIHDDGKRYRARKLVNELKPKEQEIVKVSKKEIDEKEAKDIRRLLRRSKVPKAVISSLVNGPLDDEDRSEGFWNLCKILAEKGVNEDKACVIMKATPWNKYASRRNGDYEIRKQVRKAYAPFEVRIKTKEPEAGSDELGLIKLADFMAKPKKRPEWLIEDFWIEGEWGMIGGEPKCFKSTLGLDLLYSVASGTPLFGKFKVKSPGTVIYIQNENSEWIMQDRLQRFITNRPTKKDVPLYMMNQNGFMLDEDGLDNIEKIVEKHKPRLLVLDPLMTMFHEELSDHSKVQPILQELSDIAAKSGTAIIIVHHSNKSNDPNKRGGTRLMGSQALHGWNANAWYLQNVGGGTIRMERELRGAGFMPKLDITIRDGSMGEDLYEVEVEEAHDEGPGKKGLTPETMEQDIMTILNTSARVKEVKLQELLGYNEKQATEAVDFVVGKGLAKRFNGFVIKEKQ